MAESQFRQIVDAIDALRREVAGINTRVALIEGARANGRWSVSTILTGIAALAAVGAFLVGVMK